MIYQTMYYVGLAIMILMFIISVILFKKYNIYKVVGDLTGASAKKAIENMRLNNEKNGVKSYKTSEISNERGKLTDKIFLGGRLFKNTGKIRKSSGITGNLIPDPHKSLIGEETTLLQNAEETTVLDNNQKGSPEYYFDIDFDLMLIDTCESI